MCKRSCAFPFVFMSWVRVVCVLLKGGKGRVKEVVCEYDRGGGG